MTEEASLATVDVEQTSINPAGRSASFAGTDLGLTSAEFNVFRVLVSHAGLDLLGKTVPIAAEKISRQLIANKRKVFVNSPREHLAAYRIQRPEEENVSAVFMFPKKPGVILNTLSDSLWLRIEQETERLEELIDQLLSSQARPPATRRHHLCTKHRFWPEHQCQTAGTPPNQLIHCGGPL
jgi:hypothetical protein